MCVENCQGCKERAELMAQVEMLKSSTRNMHKLYDLAEQEGFGAVGDEIVEAVLNYIYRLQEQVRESQANGQLDDIEDWDDDIDGDGWGEYEDFEMS